MIEEDQWNNQEVIVRSHQLVKQDKNFVKPDEQGLGRRSSKGPGHLAHHRLDRKTSR